MAVIDEIPGIGVTIWSPAVRHAVVNYSFDGGPKPESVPSDCPICTKHIVAPEHALFSVLVKFDQEKYQEHIRTDVKHALAIIVTVNGERRADTIIFGTTNFSMSGSIRRLGPDEVQYEKFQISLPWTGKTNYGNQ